MSREAIQSSSELFSELDTPTNHHGTVTISMEFNAAMIHWSAGPRSSKGTERTT